MTEHPTLSSWALKSPRCQHGLAPAGPLPDQEPPPSWKAGTTAAPGTVPLSRNPSDSDMYIARFPIPSLTGRQAIADGKLHPRVRQEHRAAAYGIDRHIRFHHKVISRLVDRGKPLTVHPKPRHAQRPHL